MTGQQELCFVKGIALSITSFRSPYPDPQSPNPSPPATRKNPKKPENLRESHKVNLISPKVDLPQINNISPKVNIKYF